MVTEKYSRRASLKPVHREFQVQTGSSMRFHSEQSCITLTSTTSKQQLASMMSSSMFCRTTRMSSGLLQGIISVPSGKITEIIYLSIKFKDYSARRGAHSRTVQIISSVLDGFNICNFVFALTETSCRKFFPRRYTFFNRRECLTNKNIGTLLSKTCFI